jgi:uncharacterized protein (TIGR02246 family)
MLRRLTLLLCLVGAIAVPASGQQVSVSAEQQLRHDIDAILTKWLDALNRGDAKAAALFFLPDAPAINPNGMVRAGGQEYINRIELQHQQNLQTTAKIDQVQAIGRDAAYAVGPWVSTYGANNESQAHGVWLQVYERKGAVWRISASSFTRVGGETNSNRRP